MRRLARALAVAFVAVVLAAPVTAAPVGTASSTRPAKPPRKPKSCNEGVASFYARFHQGRRTASGEQFNMHALTAAHRSLPFGTKIRVTNLRNGRSVIVRINDRGPFVRGRLIDVTREVARQLGFVQNGVATVRIETVDPGVVLGCNLR